MKVLKQLKEIVIAINIMFLLIMFIETYAVPSITIPIQISNAVNFTIDTNVYALLGTIIIVMTITAITGLQIVGSGLNTTGVTIFAKIVSRIIIWVITTLATYYVLSGLPSLLINTIVAIMSLMYALGFADEFNEVGSDTL